MEDCSFQCKHTGNLFSLAKGLFKISNLYNFFTAASLKKKICRLGLHASTVRNSFFYYQFLSNPKNYSSSFYLLTFAFQQTLQWILKRLWVLSGCHGVSWWILQLDCNSAGWFVNWALTNESHDNHDGKKPWTTMKNELNVKKDTQIPIFHNL